MPSKPRTINKPMKVRAIFSRWETAKGMVEALVETWTRHACAPNQCVHPPYSNYGLAKRPEVREAESLARGSESRVEMEPLVPKRVTCDGGNCSVLMTTRPTFQRS